MRNGMNREIHIKVKEENREISVAVGRNLLNKETELKKIFVLSILIIV
jgi:hypothetical protein